MKNALSLRAGLVLVMVCLLAGWIARVEAGQSAQNGAAVQINSNDIGGVVASSKGPEAGVWVIAETTDLPTKFVKIVVTDDQGRYLLPELPKARYQVWVRGYGLVDSEAVQGTPGNLIKLTAEEALALRPIATQEQWIDVMKQGCQQRHQLGDYFTRDLTHLARFNFKSPAEAWATRIHFGQAGADRMSGTLPRFVDQERAVKMFTDWTDRIAAGELPPIPPRPDGVERNLVITMWDWGKPSGHPHDEISTDKRHPTVNANGPVYGADFNDDDLLWVDPTKNTAGAIRVPTIAARSTMRPTWPKQIPVSSPFYEKEILWNGVCGPHNPMMDEKGRVWVTSNIRPA